MQNTNLGNKWNEYINQKQEERSFYRDGETLHLSDKLKLPEKILKNIFFTNKGNEKSLSDRFDSEPFQKSCKEALLKTYKNLSQENSNILWSRKRKFTHRTQKTQESIDRLITLSLTKLLFPTLNINRRDKPIRLKNTRKEAFDALMALRKILDLPQKIQKNAYINQASIAIEKTKNLFSSLNTEDQLFLKDYILYDLKQLQKIHTQLKPSSLPKGKNLV